MKLSVVVPHMYGLKDVDFMLKKCVKSLVGHDELIIVANDGLGYGASVNLGMRLATGDHIIVANNDTWLTNGTLRDLALNNVITTPKVVPEPRDSLPRSFFCVPRIIYEDIYEKYGDFFDERFEGGYWEDDDLHDRLWESEIAMGTIETVVVHHLNGGGLTMKQIGEQEYFDKNRDVYFEKKGTGG